MIFTGIRITETKTIIDGYSNAKTIKGALKDLAREVAKVNKLEADSLIDNMLETIENLNDISGEYHVELEEVSQATRMVDDNTNEYKEANYYLCICFVN